MSERLIIRRIPPYLARRIGILARKRGERPEAAALRLLCEALALEARWRELKGLQTWSEADRAEFEAAIADLSRKSDGPMPS
jgi:hypothetical protein